MNQLLPDWAPNIHPLLIHFPIVLFLIAILADVSLLIFAKDWLRNAAVALFTLSTLAALATYFSGKQAIDTLMLPLQAELTASSHADWALYTLIYFGILTVLRWFLFWKQHDKKKIILATLIILGIGGAGMLGYTADKGGKLVYKYGVGVQKVK
ncbi:MAG: DUF2231 domain-containing protein [Cyclobacteriaceae bacterium]|nr:DUF2231 domain-containing protein [Cyclobacteriaceae bacterium]